MVSKTRAEKMWALKGHLPSPAGAAGEQTGYLGASQMTQSSQVSQLNQAKIPVTRCC